MIDPEQNPSSFDLSGIKEVLPDELSSRYFANLDAALQRVDKLQMDRTLGGLADRGFLRSGDTFTEVANNVLGPSIDRRNSILLPELRRASDQGREERLSAVAYGRQKEAAATEHQYKLEELDKQAQIRRMLLELEDSLNGNDSGGFDWGGLAGQAAGIGAGAFFGGAGGAAGKNFGAKLFSSTATGGK